MFKLPQLQPSLTSTAEGRSKSARACSTYGAYAGLSRLPREGTYDGTIEVKSWESQARDITSDIAGSEKYKSIALHAEVKLAEALEKCIRVSPVTLSKEGEERPNRLKTAVCCQLLGEFAELCGPFSSVLHNLRDELLKSVYSGYYVSERGMLAFDQLTWFAVAERLEREKEVMLEEREMFKRQIAEQGDCLARIEDQLSSYQHAMQSAQLEAASMKGDLESLARGRDTALKEAKTGREELKRARKEWLRMKDDLDAEKEANGTVKEAHEQLNAAYKQHVSESQAQVGKLQRAYEEARLDADSRVPVEAIQGTKQALDQATRELAMERFKAEDLAGVVEMLKRRAGGMTPRPNWAEFSKHGIEAGEGVRTQAMLSLVSAQLESRVLRAEVEEVLAKLEEQAQATRLLEAVLHPDPLPSMIQLSVVTDTSAYFITEAVDAADGDGERGADGEPSSSLSAEGLGLGPLVPRCLRWPAKQMVTMRQMSLQATEDSVAAIWEAKERHERSNLRQHPMSFLYHYYAHVAEGATADHNSVVQHAYSLFHACSTHAASSTTVQLFAAVLTGQIAEAVWADQRAMLAGMFEVLSALPSVAGNVTGELCVPVEDVREAMQNYFPARGQWQVHRLKEAVSAEFQDPSIPLTTLYLALQPKSSSAAPDESDDKSGTEQGRTERDRAPAPPGKALVDLLSAQHLEELETYGEEISKALEQESSRGGPKDSELTVSAFRSALRALMPEEEVMRCLECVAGQPAEAALATTTSFLPHAAVPVHRLLRALHLLRPQRSYDLAKAMSWVQSKGGASGAANAGNGGVASLGELPRVV